MTFTVDDVRAGMARMVDLVSRSTGDKMTALTTVARRCGMAPRSLRRLINGDTKATGLQTYINLREGYRRFLKAKIAELQDELKAIEQEDPLHDVWEFDLKISALEKQLAERKEQLSHASSADR